MYSKKIIFLLVFISFLTIKINAQELPKWKVTSIDSVHYQKIDSSKNNLIHSNLLYPLLVKLYKAKHSSKENVVFVHLGDSHIQADLQTAAIRNEFQNYFGNAGRGIVFPYQIAKSNAPFDISSSTKSTWKNNRIARPDTLISCGISAFGIESQSQNPELDLELRTINGRQESFDKVTLFTGGTFKELLFEYNDSLSENKCLSIDTNFSELNLDSPTSGFKLSFATNEPIQFFGASLEKKEVSGIRYHSIGANGAKYSDFNKTSHFWKQLHHLNADCYIISLGTNEAQDSDFDAALFIDEVNKMVTKIKLVSTNASIIITTPPVSYFKKTHPNPTLKVITDALTQYCDDNEIVLWDLFSICNGLEGAKTWKSSQLLRTDLVHFSKEGYFFQGAIFVAAFAKVWNNFLNSATLDFNRFQSIEQKN